MIKKGLFEKQQEDVLEFKIRKFGPENQENVIYFIHEKDEQIFGFFAMYRYWLEYLYIAHVLGYVPVIYTDRDFSYYEKDGVKGTHNVFEYYFYQPGSITLKQVKHSCRVVLSQRVHRNMVEVVYTGAMNHYQYTDGYLKAMAEIVKKYIKFNNVTWNYINRGLKSLGINNKRILGIHARGADYKKGYDNHPIFIDEKEYYNSIDDLCYDNKYDMIFLATDDSIILKNFIDKYGNKLIYYRDVYRTDKTRSVIFTKEEREQHKYLLGLEVLRDMYTLSLCKGLVAGISQVSICSRINKIARGGDYEDLCIIDKGIHKNGRRFIVQ